MNRVNIVDKNHLERSVNGRYQNAQELSLEGLYDVLESPGEYLGYTVLRTVSLPKRVSAGRQSVLSLPLTRKVPSDQARRKEITKHCSNKPPADSRHMINIITHCIESNASMLLYSCVISPQR